MDEAPVASRIVAVMVGGGPGIFQALGALHVISLDDDVLVSGPGVPTLELHWNDKGLPSGSCALTRKTMLPPGVVPMSD